MKEFDYEGDLRMPKRLQLNGTAKQSEWLA